MQQYANGDFAAFEALYLRNKGGLYRYLLRQLHDKSLVEDIFQEVWGRVISSASQYEASANFTTWLYTIARNKMIDHIRHLKLVSSLVVNQSSSEHTGDVNSTVEALEADNNGFSQRDLPEQSIEQAAQAAAIEHCMTKLAVHHLDCFLLKEEAGLSAPEIAQVVNTGLEATKSRLRTAYKQLRECLSLKLDLAIKPSQGKTHSGEAKQ